MSQVVASAHQIEDFTCACFQKAGLPEQDARTAAQVLTETELRGVYSHGMQRIPEYTEKIRLGAIKARPEMKIVRETAATALIDGDAAIGMVSGTFAMRTCIEKAARTGIGAAAVFHGSHFGMAACYSLIAARAGFIGLCTSNCFANMTVFGGIDRVIGTNPISIAFPGGQYPAIVADLATGQSAFGKIDAALRQGIKIPADWAVDRAGLPSDDPAKILAGGAMLPFGGAKGSAIAIMAELFASALSGSFYSYQETERRRQSASPYDLGFFMCAVDITAFQDRADYERGVDAFYAQVKNGRKRENTKEIYLPGEIEQQTYERNLERGIAVDESLLAELIALQRQLGVEHGPAQWS